MKIIYINSYEELPYIITKLIHYHYEDSTINRAELLITKDRTVDFSLACMCNIPGISVTKAKKILEEFDINFTLTSKGKITELKDIDGIGSKLQDNVLRKINKIS